MTDIPVTNPSPEQPELANAERRLFFWFSITATVLVVATIATAAVLSGRRNEDGTRKTLKELSIELFGREPDPSAPPALIATPTVPRLLDARSVAAEAANPRLYAVMIDNHGNARPQSGLSEAPLVFEAEAEGGITRYMAVMTEDSGFDRLGPVRSARPYFIDWARELGALYVHVGGSPNALAKLAQLGSPDINEFYNAPYFWRDEQRFAPHNVLTSAPLLTKYQVKKPLAVPSFMSWLFKSDLALDTRPASSTVDIPYYNRNYYVSWVYDRESNRYTRHLGGEVHRDEAGIAITATNILIASMEHIVLDEKLRIELDNIGEGKAIICLDGTCTEGTWSKPSATGRTRFSVNGEEVRLNAGNTWVEAVRPTLSVTY